MYNLSFFFVLAEQDITDYIAPSWCSLFQELNKDYLRKICSLINMNIIQT